jgi:outer membrane protein assembly factor BamB
MQWNRALKLSLTGSIIVLLLLGSILPSVSAVSIDTEDGLWSDNFGDNSTTFLINATSNIYQDPDNNEIHLLKTLGNSTQTYSFADARSHAAYFAWTPFSFDSPVGRFFEHFFLSPTGLSKNTFNKQLEYQLLKYHDNRNISRDSSGIQKNIIFHFRFQLDGTADDVGDLTIKWFGKATNAQSIDMYYWKYNALLPTGKWEKTNSTTNGKFFKYTLTTDQLAAALDSYNYIDICVVAYGTIWNVCTLYTDYIQLLSTKQGLYKTGYAYVQTDSAITLPSFGYWDLLTWRDSTPSNTNISYQVLYYNGTAWTLIPDKYLSNNSKGFYKPPISLLPLAGSVLSIRLQANLSTTDPSVTPSLYNWTLGWQTGTKWQDLFHSQYRIGEQTNINWVNGSVNISLVSGGWPMFGQNPSNTRTSLDTPALTNDTYWWSKYCGEPRNQTPLSLILDNGVLYVTSTKKDVENTGWIIRYPTIIVPSNNISEEYESIYKNQNKIYYFQNFSQQDRGLVGSPAISGQYLVVASGRLDSPNYVYAYAKDNPNDNEWLWRYDNGTDLCYWGSPIIANGIVYVTAWSGDETKAGYHINNIILALDLETGEQLWFNTLESSSTSGRSPAWSVSTPACSNGKIVVGCMNDLSGNLFAFDAVNGTLLWNTSVGTIGKAAPVIYDNTVYVVSENNTVPFLFPFGPFKRTQTMLSAVSLDNGSILWQSLLGKKKYSRLSHLGDPTFSYAETTPVIADGVLYVVAPDWNVTAFDLSKHTALWSLSLPGRPRNPSLLTSSPAYAGGILYISVPPEGILWALNTSTKKFLWSYTTVQTTKNPTPITTDPITANGLVFFGDANGWLYIVGSYVQPNRQVNGSIISKPIQIPTGYWWKSFSANTSTNQSTSVNHITFSLLDMHNRVLKTLHNGDNLLVANLTLERTLQLRADLWANNGSVNPQLFSWNVTFVKDEIPPFIDRNSLNPSQYSNAWVNVVIPEFTINVKDNITGLLVSSAQYTLRYISQNQTRTITQKAMCTGANGTTDPQLMTVNLSQLDFFENITALRSLRFNITDLAGNLASQYFQFNQDTTPPVSHVIASSLKKRYNATASYIWINASSWDNGTSQSNVSNVELYYRYSPTGNFSGIWSDWIYYADSSEKNPHWKFFFTTPSQHGGYFQVATKAYDKAGNNESLPATGDASFVYDWTIPDLPGLAGQTLWFNDRPQFSTTFTDDFKLDTIQYRFNLDTAWTTLASHVNSSSYFATWQLNQTDWNRMNPGQMYYLFFHINDTLGNVRLVTNTNEALSIGKDLGELTIVLDLPTEPNPVITSHNFTVRVDANDVSGSGISAVALYYQYSKDNKTWTDWVHYEENITAEPFMWNFTIPEGEGYYKFQSVVVDYAGNEAQSNVISRVVVHLPTDTVLIMVALVIVLLLIGAVLYLRWRKKA